jgi:hypothetical protein
MVDLNFNDMFNDDAIAGDGGVMLESGVYTDVKITDMSFKSTKSGGTMVNISFECPKGKDYFSLTLSTKDKQTGQIKNLGWRNQFMQMCRMAGINPSVVTVVNDAFGSKHVVVPAEIEKGGLIALAIHRELSTYNGKEQNKCILDRVFYNDTHHTFTERKEGKDAILFTKKYEDVDNRKPLDSNADEGMPLF